MKGQVIGICKALYFLPLLVWLGIILMFSFQSYEAQSIQPYLKTHITKQQAVKIVPDVIIHYGKGRIVGKTNPYDWMEFIFRKAAHLFIYGVLGILACWAFTKLGFKGWRRSAGSILILLCAAALDEWNQFYRPHRTGTRLDVGVDLTGGCLGMLMVLLILKLHSMKK